MRKLKRFTIFSLLILTVSFLIIGVASAETVNWQSLLKQTMPDGDKFNQISDLSKYKSTSQTKAAFPAFKGGNQIGVVYYSAPKGYSGNIQTLVALDMKGTILKVNIFSQSETPAYTGALSDGSYQRQFEGITLADKMVFLVGTRPSKRGEVATITGATETSKPIALSVSEARKLFNEMYRK